MKVIKKCVEQPFVPVRLEIALETEKEVEAFIEMCGMYQSIPEIVKKYRPNIKEGMLSNMLRNIYNELL